MTSKHPLHDLRGFKVAEILGIHTEHKTINARLERVNDDGNKEEAVVLLEKKAIRPELLDALLISSEALDWRNEMINDIYAVYHLQPSASSAINGELLCAYTT